MSKVQTIINLDNILESPFADFSKKLIKLCQPLFKQFRFNYLDYGRFYPDRTVWGLVTDPHFVDDLFHQPFYATKAPFLAPNGAFLWAARNSPEFLENSSEKYNYFHGVSYVTHTSEYIETLSIAAPASEIDSLNVFLNERPLMHLFMKYLIKEAIATEKFLSTTRGCLAERMVLAPPPENTKAKLVIEELESCAHMRKNHNLMLIGEELVGMSAREKECIQYLRLGYSNKMIAKALDLSHRTIEKFFEKIYVKCNLKGRNDLLRLLTDQ